MNTPPWGRYERLRPDQIEAIRDCVPLAYLPWGALEWHSYHNPIGLDGMQAHGQCQALAQRTGGVVLPPVYVGADTIKPYKGFPHTLDHSADLVARLCAEFLEQLADEGFRVVIVITGHCSGGHTAALQQAADAFQARHPAVGVWMIPSFEPIKDTYPANHAARGETSWQLCFEPDAVDLARLPPDRVATLDEDGVWGDDPREASAQEGEAMLRLFCERCIPTINDLLRRV